MTTSRTILSVPRLTIFSSLAVACALTAGPYAPAAGEAGSTAVAYDDSAFVGWASSVVEYKPGKNVDDDWKDTSLCLGEADEDGVYGITCLGNGGTITLSFDKPIANGDGWDFAVFENGFCDGFLELAYVEVSSDGKNFVRFPCHSITAKKVGAYATTMDPTDIDGLASKYRVGYGTPFDLSDLEGVDGAEKVDLDAITEVRLVDIIGDGSYEDSDGNAIYDPYPTVGSGGFDLDAVGVRYYQTTKVSSGGNYSSVASGDSDDFAGSSSASIVISDDDLLIIWASKDGAKYEVQYSTDLKTWSKLRGDITGTGEDMALETAMPTVPTFYRVVKE